MGHEVADFARIPKKYALYCYDYCLTFDREVKFFWGRRPSLAATLFFTFRYAALLNTIPEIWTLCSRTLTKQVIFAALRVYAIYRRSQLAFGVVLVSGLAAPAVVIVRNSICDYILSKVVFSLLPHFRVCTLGILGGTQSYEWREFRVAPFGQRATLREILLRDTALSFGWAMSRGGTCDF
ncbi:hypothetical protein POSPLADRAFT_1047321 [Postia placenta MAD-698-R-SB12]|uniref:DUF6533 domain-containing protein n=1 Tax=Postia placenta MAD-698-R-SB12 TaxID=670580 RepID=A0A1X6MXH2_9APHY|nr:hypothetical protein POSPLADRAFT_1047321 [Postia placenta MAD-698-R-SB12]OSX61039.1 hypothetical protein POSPLADRAFT_1047321 [Postia placenta MAD-698-R-SB12]